MVCEVGNKLYFLLSFSSTIFSKYFLETASSIILKIVGREAYSFGISDIIFSILLLLLLLLL